MLNSEEIKPVASAIFELCLSEGISQSARWSVSWMVSQSVDQSVKDIG